MPAQNTPKQCPRCHRYMTLRNGRNGKFWGCTGYPNCRHTEDYKDPAIADGPSIGFFAFNKDIVRELQAKFRAGLKFDGFKPSAYQKAVGDFVTTGSGNGLVDAVAGSGKSTTLLWLMWLIKGHPEIVTLHSHGFACLRKVFPALTPDNIDEYKKDGIAKELLPDLEVGANMVIDSAGKLCDIVHSDQAIDNKYARSILVNLASLVQNTLTDPDDMEAVRELIDRFGVEMNGCEEVVLEKLPELIRICAERTTVIDFDDMIWLPVYLNLPIIKYDWVFCDEAQDLNKVQIELVLRTVKKGGRIVCVGDPKQSIYGFRGADLEAIPNIINATNATQLPLSITYRCPLSHVRLAQNLVPHLEASPNAIEGEIRYAMPQHKAIAEMQSGNMVLCRLNAPLVKVAYALIRSGKKAIIRGRDIGKGLIQLVDKMKAANIPELCQKLEEYRRRELDKLFAKGARETAITSLNDRIDTLIELTDGIYDLSQLRNRIETIFTDKVEGVVCSSVHRAKGLEADSVYVLNPELMPFPKAKRVWEKQQELNCAYVAVTRSKRLLTFVDGYPGWMAGAVAQTITEELTEKQLMQEDMLK